MEIQASEKVKALPSPHPDVTRSNPEVAWAAGGMISTLGDLRTWANALATGTLLNLVTQALRLHTIPLTNGLTYGLRIINLFEFFGHGGKLLGYNSAMYYTAERRCHPPRVSKRK